SSIRLDLGSRFKRRSPPMKLSPTLLARIFVGITVIITASAAFAQSETSSPSTAPSPAMPPGTSTTSGTGAASSGMPNEGEMMKQMMEMAKLNENHKLLTSLDGTWNYKIKFWTDP